VQLVKNNLSEQLSLINQQQADVSHSEILQQESTTIDVSISMPLAVDNIMQPSDQFQEIPTNISDNFHNHFSFNTNNQTENDSLDSKLQKWVVDFHVTHNCVNALLAILRSEGLQLPKDTRTLLKTPKTGSHNIISIHPGSYIHLGVKFMLLKFLTPHIEHFENNYTVQLSFNIDGVPLSSSSKSSFWPILLSFVNVHYLLKTVILVGLYHGKFKKPTSSFEFLNPFITEINEIIFNGLEINDKILKFKISQVICDAPAKSFILNVKNNNAYHGCNSCIVEGTYLSHRMSFLDMDAPLRTDQSFRNKLDEYYHKDYSPLEDLPVNITSVVVLEYMHNI